MMLILKLLLALVEIPINTKYQKWLPNLAEQGEECDCRHNINIFPIQ